ncbi:hypothetical protein Tco_1112697 [Tanacetum coccineum]|uniref:Uncharacterized protein n=1 Tax=Tanacetum coccineum TaxID=301880 RepID=A0ABQ5IQD6_9ASTR
MVIRYEGESVINLMSGCQLESVTGSWRDKEVKKERNQIFRALTASADVPSSVTETTDTTSTLPPPPPPLQKPTDPTRASHEAREALKVLRMKRIVQIKGVKKEALHSLKAETGSIHMLSESQVDC